MDFKSRIKSVWFDEKPYKSAIEARWAIFYSVIDERVQYEAFTFDLCNTGLSYKQYTPDFYLPSLDIFHEVKLVPYPSLDEFRRCRALALESGKKCLITWSKPSSSTIDALLYDSDGECFGPVRVGLCSICCGITVDCSMEKMLCGHDPDGFNTMRNKELMHRVNTITFDVI